MKARQKRKQKFNKYIYMFGLASIVLALSLVIFLILKPHQNTHESQGGNHTHGISINNSSSGSVGLAPNSTQGTVKVNDAVFPANYVIGGTINPSDISIDQLLRLTNEQRAKNGADVLTINVKLTVAAQNKCQDMIDNNYWSHYSPSGTTPWSFDVAQGYYYLKLGENLAAGFFDARTTINGWMNSVEHRNNLLDPAFSEVGFAVCKSNEFAGTNNLPSLIVVQHLGAPDSEFFWD